MHLKVNYLCHSAIDTCIICLARKCLLTVTTQYPFEVNVSIKMPGLPVINNKALNLIIEKRVANVLSAFLSEYPLIHFSQAFIFRISTQKARKVADQGDSFAIRQLRQKRAITLVSDHYHYIFMLLIITFKTGAT